MNCPKDNTPLKTEVYESSIEIDRCPLCGGIWLDAGELEQIQQTIENDYSDQLDISTNTTRQSFEMAKQLNEETLQCPKCNDKMIKKEYAFSSQIIVDLCISCRGIWLDVGELERLEIFYEKQLQNKNSQSKLYLFWNGIKNYFNSN